MVQSIDQTDSKKAIITGLAQPDDSLHSSCIDVPHDLDLGGLFIWIVLEDTDSIDPEPSTLSSLPKDVKHRFQILSDM